MLEGLSITKGRIWEKKMYGYILYSPKTFPKSLSRATLVALLTVNGLRGRWQDKARAIENSYEQRVIEIQERPVYFEEERFTTELLLLEFPQLPPWIKVEKKAGLFRYTSCGISINLIYFITWYYFNNKCKHFATRLT